MKDQTNRHDRTKDDDVDAISDEALRRACGGQANEKPPGYNRLYTDGVTFPNGKPTINGQGLPPPHPSHIERQRILDASQPNIKK